MSKAQSRDTFPRGANSRGTHGIRVDFSRFHRTGIFSAEWEKVRGRKGHRSARTPSHYEPL